MRKRCFVIMPFSETTEKHTEKYWTGFFEEFIQPMVKSLGYECVRSVAEPGNIIEKIFDDLIEADIVLAVLTDYNPNVWYELGTRHSIRSGTIMMIEEPYEIPFDIQQYGVIFYKYPRAKKKAEFKKKLRAEKVRLIKELKGSIEVIEKGSKLDSPALALFSNRNERPCWVGYRGGKARLPILNKALDEIENRLIIIGQNLFSLTVKENGFMRKLYSILKKKKIRVDILICENEKSIVEAYEEIIDKSFGEHLGKSIIAFKKWEKHFNNKKYKSEINLNFSRKLGTLSLAFIDPNNDKGKLLLTPVVDPDAEFRPCFWMSRKGNESIFDYYWKKYKSMIPIV